MDPWVLWLIAAVVLAIGEIATMGFFLAPFAAGALVAALVAAAGTGTAITLIVFLLVSIAALAALRPIARSHRKMPAAMPHRHGGARRPHGDGRRADRQQRGRRLRQARR